MAKLLVIDDELEVTDFLKGFFEKHALEVFTAATVEEGLNLLQSSQPDLVLLDLRLGPVSGLEFLRLAKPLKTQTPVIVLTAVDDQNVAEMAKGLGAVDYLTKPFFVGDLERVVLSRLKPGA